MNPMCLCGKKIMICINFVRNLNSLLYFKDYFSVLADKIKSFKIKHYGYQIENEIFCAGLKTGWEIESIIRWNTLCENSKIVAFM
jgi:hypothetical protein